MTKLFFTESYEKLKEKLSSIRGEWDDSQSNKKIFRLDGGVMSWYETTGTIQFQGMQGPKTKLENLVCSILMGKSLENEVKGVKTSEQTNLKPYASKDSKMETNPRDISEKYLKDEFENSEIIIGIVSAVGTEIHRVTKPLEDRLKKFGYHSIEIKVSSLLSGGKYNGEGEYKRIKGLMEAGDKLRADSKNNAILAYGVAKQIRIERNQQQKEPKKAFIVNSLKHPDEVGTLRKIYGQGFYLFGVHADKKRRLHYLVHDKNLTDKQASELTDIDEDEKVSYGQRTRDTYHLSDFFINFGKNDDQVKNTIQRFLELMFSHPYKNPTFDEFAMFMAFSSSVRSGDLSRQVGAVITKNRQIIATGANECPISGGGLYWAEMDESSGEILDKEDGKDYKRGQDSNKSEQNEIIEQILSEASNKIQTEQINELRRILNKSRIRDLTEFGRVVHAEMEAILSCGRTGIDCLNATLYCTTFPCHNCAKHIIAAGIKRVVYVEPYPKSKALEFHSDSIDLKAPLDTNNKQSNDERVIFEPFTGVGARRFLDFFSMNLGMGNKLKRKNEDGSTLEWRENLSRIRVALLPESYTEIEKEAASIFDQQDLGVSMSKNGIK